MPDSPQAIPAPTVPPEERPARARTGAARLEVIYRLRGVLVALPAVAALAAPPAGNAMSGVFWVGVGLVLLGWGVRIWAQVHLGYRLERRMALVTCGPFRFCRNPIYLANAAIVVGVVAATDPPWQVAAGAAVWCAVVFGGVVAYEEQRLRRSYGKAYLRYCGSVARWAPGRPAPAPRCAHRLASDALLVEALVPLVLLPVLVRSLLLG
jgi:protein-S-isoprenylcysteine O-methyltransferase Ste14